MLPDNVEDTSPCLSEYKNKFIYISSFCVSQREMLDSLMRVTDTTEQEWKLVSRPVQVVYKEGLELFQKGDFTGMIGVLYGRNFFKDNAGNYELTKGLDNEKLGLPKEDLDQYSKIAVKTAENL